MVVDRPKNLNLMTIKQPVPAVVSILHRVSGVVIFLLLPVFLLCMEMAVYSEVDFLALSGLLELFWIKVFVVLALSAVLFHLLAGIRHLLADFGIAHSLQAARISAWMTLVFWLGFSGLIVFRVWL